MDNFDAAEGGVFTNSCAFPLLLARRWVPYAELFARVGRGALTLPVGMARCFFSIQSVIRNFKEVSMPHGGILAGKA